MSHRITICIHRLAVIGFLFGIVPAAGSAQISFTPLGDLPGGQVRSQALAVSADGSVVVGASSSAFSMQNDEAFRWTAAGGMIGLGAVPSPFPGFESFAFGVSNDGTVVVGSTGVLTFQAFRWTAESGMILLGDLPGGSPTSRARSTSADGSVVVGGSDDGSFKPFRWTATEGMVPLGGPPGELGLFSQANDVSADGTVIVGSIATVPRPSGQPFRWTAETGMVRLDVAGGANAVSADGSAAAALFVLHIGKSRKNRSQTA